MNYDPYAPGQYNQWGRGNGGGNAQNMPNAGAPMPQQFAPNQVPPLATPPVQQQSGGLLDVSNPAFIKGALVGAVLAYVLTNEKVQQTSIKSAAKAWRFMQGGLEEMKERFRDAEAELNAETYEE